MRSLGCSLLLAASLWARPASARNVYLNGVRLDASVIVKNQKFQGCDVRFDESGDVWITAKGFQIEVAPAGPGATSQSRASDSAPPPATLTKRYFLVAPQTRRGLPQYDVDVLVNGAFVARIRNDDGRTALEITKHVRPGNNQVRVRATKVAGERRVSSSPSDVMEVMIGEGTVGGGTVSIVRTVLTYRRNASETRTFSEEFSLVGR